MSAEILEERQPTDFVRQEDGQYRRNENVYPIFPICKIPIHYERYRGGRYGVSYFSIDLELDISDRAQMKVYVRLGRPKSQRDSCCPTTGEHVRISYQEWQESKETHVAGNLGDGRDMHLARHVGIIVFGLSTPLQFGNFDIAFTADGTGLRSASCSAGVQVD